MKKTTTIAEHRKQKHGKESKGRYHVSLQTPDNGFTFGYFQTLEIAKDECERILREEISVHITDEGYPMPVEQVEADCEPTFQAYVTEIQLEWRFEMIDNTPE